MKRTLEEEAKLAVKNGNWMIRTDKEGISYHGFQWEKRGRWTIAPDWNEDAECGGGLHGQAQEASGFRGNGNRLLFCKTKGKRIIINDKIKVQKAMILLINQLPENLSVGGYLDLSGTQIKELPERFMKILVIGGKVVKSNRDSLKKAYREGRR